jgi:biopolymer transport protein ExbB
MDIFFIIALVITSIVAVTFIVERGLALRWIKVIPTDVVYSIQAYRGENQLQHLRNVCQNNPSTLSRLLLFATEHLDWPKTETVDVLETRARHEVTKLERGLVVLEIIVGIAPLLGLVGTIYGLITLFGHMDPSGMQEHTKFAQGISLALNATLLGLLIAIPALVSWSYYSKKVETLAVEMESLCDEFLRKHYRQDERPATQPVTLARQQSAERPVPLNASGLPAPKPSAHS